MAETLSSLLANEYVHFVLCIWVSPRFSNELDIYFLQITYGFMRVQHGSQGTRFQQQKIGVKSPTSQFSMNNKV